MSKGQTITSLFQFQTALINLLRNYSALPLTELDGGLLHHLLDMAITRHNFEATVKQGQDFLNDMLENGLLYKPCITVVVPTNDSRDAEILEEIKALIDNASVINGELL